MSRFANRIRVLDDDTPDSGCGVKLFRRDAFLELAAFRPHAPVSAGAVIRAGGRVVSVPVNDRVRRSGRSNYGTLDRLGPGGVDLAGVFWLQRRSRRPELEGGGS